MNIINQKRLKLLTVVLVCILIFWWMFIFDFRVNQLNNILSQNVEISNYPYKFKVINIDDGVATLNSPRSANAPAVRSLRFMFPYLKYEDDDSDTMVTAQKELAHVQSKAAEIVLSEPDIHEIKWVLDKRWLQNHGVVFF